IPPQGVIFAHVWIDAKDPPKSVMLQFHAGTAGWEQRAVWGDEKAIDWGALNTKSRVPMGAWPETGKWVKLEVPIDRVGLKPGDKIEGFALTQFGGTTYWDKVGVKGRSDPAADPRRSFEAWRKQSAGKTVQGVPNDVANLLKQGPAKVKD